MGGFSASSRPSATPNTKHVRFGKPAVESQALPNRYEKSYKSKKEKDALAAAQQTLLVPLPLTTKWYEATLPILQDTLVGPATENMKPLERTRLRKEKVKSLEAKAAALYQDQIGLYQTESLPFLLRFRLRCYHNCKDILTFEGENRSGVVTG